MSDLSDVVTEYTEALYRGEDLMPAFLAQYGEQWAELPAFLELSRALHQTLKPTQPTPAFKQQLKEQLVSGQPIVAIHHEHTNRHRVLWMGAAVGSALSIMGVGMWLVRRFRTPSSTIPQPMPATTA